MTAPCCPSCGQVIVARRPTLTKRQAEMLTLIRDSIRDQGCAPSFNEMAAAFGYRSLSTVHEHVTSLVEKGYLTREFNRERALTLVDDAPVAGAQA